jgi:hypothetical protein
MPAGFVNPLGLMATTVLGLTILGSVPPNETRAAVVTVPNDLAAQEGNSNNEFPFSVPMRYQQVFASSAFSSIPGPALITQISFRPDAQFGSAFSFTIPNIIIDLSTTSAAPDMLDPIFSNNIGPDNTAVYSGSLSLSSSFTGTTGGSKDFDISIQLQKPFLYDNTLGNLLLDVTDFTNNGIPVFDAENVFGDSISRIWNDDVTASRGLGGPTDFDNTLGLVTQFTFSSVSAREPSSLLQLGSFITLIFLYWCRYRIKTRY